MKITSTPDQYGLVAVALHWSIAALVVVALASGFAADTIGAGAHGALRAHVVAGILIGVLTIARIGWWLLADTRPAADPNRLRRLLAKAVHVLLMIIPLGMAASGIGMMVLTGAGEQLLAEAPGPLPDFGKVPPRAPHGAGAIALLVLLVLHVAAALHHQLIMRDGLIGRMWFSARR